MNDKFHFGLNYKKQKQRMNVEFPFAYSDKIRYSFISPTRGQVTIYLIYKYYAD